MQNTNSSSSEKVCEGTYFYLKDGVKYSEESFVVNRIPAIKGLSYEVNFSNRADSGELLRISVLYEVNQFNLPTKVQISKTLGEKRANETFEFNSDKRVLYYTFDNGSKKTELEKSVSGKIQIVTPTFATMTLFSMIGKVTTLERRSYSIITSNNDWEFKTPLVENTIYAEYKKVEANQALNINGKVLTSTLCQIYEAPAGKDENEKAIEVHLSEHYGLPYQGHFPDNVEVIVDYLKKFQSEVSF